MSDLKIIDNMISIGGKFLINGNEYNNEITSDFLRLIFDDGIHHKGNMSLYSYDELTASTHGFGEQELYWLMHYPKDKPLASLSRVGNNYHLVLTKCYGKKIEKNKNYKFSRFEIHISFVNRGNSTLCARVDLPEPVEVFAAIDDTMYVGYQIELRVPAYPATYNWFFPKTGLTHRITYGMTITSMLTPIYEEQRLKGKTPIVYTLNSFLDSAGNYIELNAPSDFTNRNVPTFLQFLHWYFPSFGGYILTTHFNKRYYNSPDNPSLLKNFVTVKEDFNDNGDTYQKSIRISFEDFDSEFNEEISEVVFEGGVLLIEPPIPPKVIDERYDLPIINIRKKELVL